VVRCAASLLLLFARFRPDLVLTTGALPGLIAIYLGKRFRARTMWIDSVANAEEMSLAGQNAGRHADEWLAQWPDVAAFAGARYEGSVI
jgi:hypothetical protein